jgi:hypothetical protein
MRDRRFEPELHSALTEGAIWDRKNGRHEGTVEIIKCVKSRVGERYLVQGLESGRRWLVGQGTLLATYTPRKTAP